MRKKLSLDKAESMNLGATISIVNKKIMNNYAKKEYFLSMIKEVNENLMTDIHFNAILQERRTNRHLNKDN
jgi:hypothetical protein